MSGICEKKHADEAKGGGGGDAAPAGLGRARIAVLRGDAQVLALHDVVQQLLLRLLRRRRRLRQALLLIQGILLRCRLLRQLRLLLLNLPSTRSAMSIASPQSQPVTTMHNFQHIPELLVLED